MHGPTNPKLTLYSRCGLILSSELYLSWRYVLHTSPAGDGHLNGSKFATNSKLFLMCVILKGYLHCTFCTVQCNVITQHKPNKCTQPSIPSRKTTY